MLKKFDFAEVSVDCQAESHRILSTYIRYMLKKYRFGEYKHYIFQGCPRYSNYFLHINGLILQARQNLYYRFVGLVPGDVDNKNKFGFRCTKASKPTSPTYIWPKCITHAMQCYYKYDYAQTFYTC